jgi:hypothetical protein
VVNLTDGFLHIKEAAKSVGLTVVSVRMHGDGGQYRAEVLIPLLIDPPDDGQAIDYTGAELCGLLATFSGEAVARMEDRCAASAAADRAGRSGRRTTALAVAKREAAVDDQMAGNIRMMQGNARPLDLRTVEGRRWKREHAGAT